MQTLLDTNIQLNPYTRHVLGLPVHYGFLTIKQGATCLGCEKDVAGEGVKGMAVVLSCRHICHNNLAKLTYQYNACKCIYRVCTSSLKYQI